ncbi:peptidoglycan editing factor PgeF [Aquibacillus albus]|uniref:Purine nucleoside phosphorylase n=1 Tax=Aquibacillus albus TaxID=1168171 RepID=A0ABS2N0S1_9BACI|nr:peptidoglycan editing factor PgeF [Aquibacillus albus]MBM7571746.1 YfiH family protein [Aquibacillus albus]
MEPFLLNNHSTLLIEDWKKDAPTLVAGITTRDGGVSKGSFASLNLGFHVPDTPEHVLENRESLAEFLKIPLRNWVMGEQTHQTKVVVVSHADAGKGAFEHRSTLNGVDGIITSERGLLCTAMFADCVPLYFFDPITGWIGIAHAGWRGTVNKMAKEMVDSLVNQGVDVQSLRVTIGPCISQFNYEVDDKVVDHIPNNWKEKVVKRTKTGRFLLDLRKLNQEILLDSGVLGENIKVTNFCTFQDDKFFSHRRDNGMTGRMLGFIGFQTTN